MVVYDGSSFARLISRLRADSSESTNAAPPCSSFSAATISKSFTPMK